MSRPCPNCGAPGAAEARFCRLCGALLKPPAGSVDAPVSPGAETAPLSDEGRTTQGFSVGEGGASGPETTRVRRAEMESILRRSSTPPAPAVTRPETKNASVYTNGKDSAAVPSTTALAAGAEKEAVADDSTASAAPDSGAKEGAGAAVAAITEGEGPRASLAAEKRETGARRMWQIIALGLLVVAVGAGALAFYYSRGASTRDASATAPISISDQQRLVQEKLAEAETLLAKGYVADAMARLRYALKLDPSNARAHRLLGEALERTGAVNEAIEEYRAATESAPGDEQTWLRYADALRRVGRTDEAREIYQRLSSSSTEEVARLAKEQLAALPPAPQSASNTESARDARATQNRTEEQGADTGAAQPPSSAQPGSSATTPPASSANDNNAAAKNDPAASYTTAMKIIEGKDIRKMNRAELIRAYELFQYAQKGPNAADANRRLRALDKELFERRQRKQ
jgi:tetratricopeptide (TPR) repeat protein